ncbi:MAG: DUF2341 domain-containing protein [Candidatus Iainarchaeum archaeon]|uniref:DUF2341 domain-containing protein n=1 Tax=Candidatus Iainarchaeum sp. TaxID=3101447 RepID=A0A7T9DJJ3_9ARCH|nr:MAG: DUF2341 domain-containing protein [Candidatus Diapherotrites archaeon]
MNMKLVVVVLAFAICFSFAFAQGVESTSASAHADSAVELFPTSISSITTAFLNQFVDPLTNTPKGVIQYSKEQLDIFPDGSFSSRDGVDFKLKESLNTKKDSTSSELVRVNVVVFPQKLDVVEVQALQEEADVVQKSSYGNVLTLDVPENKLLAIAQLPQVESIWPDRIFHASLDGSVPQINAPALWSVGYQGQGVKVAILDSGINASHPMLVGKVILQQNFTPDPLADTLGHGTQVAGIVAGSQNGSNTYNGVAPQAQLYNIKVLDNTGNGAESWIINGINYAIDPDANPATDDGADIINLSLGGPYTSINSPISSAINAAIGAGITVVISSGNCGPGCPSSECQGFIGVTTPGNTINAITVGAVDEANQYACFSSGEIISSQIKPDVTAPGVNITSSYLGSGTLTSSGTSFAAPHVAGLVALLLQANPGMTPANVKDVLEQTADDYGAPGKDVQYGSGVINAANLLPASVIQLLHYALTTSASVIEQNQSISIALTSVSDDVSSISAVVTHPNGLQTPVTLSKSGLTWSGSFSSTAQNGAHVLDVNVTDVASAITPLQKTFIVRAPSTTGTILSHSLPPQATYGVPVTASVSFQNTGAFPTDVLVELQEWKEDYFERIRFSNLTPVNAGQTVSIPVVWTPSDSLGNKSIKLVATFDDSALGVDQNVIVADGNIPIIRSISFPSTTIKQNPILVSVAAEDLTHLHGTLHVATPTMQKDVNLSNVRGWDGNQFLRADIEAFELGNYSFTVELCDEYDNCTISPAQNFTVNNCSNPSALIFTSDVNADRYAFLNSNYCVGVWQVLEQTPTHPFLQFFPLVYWDAGTSYASTPDVNATTALRSFTGSIILEGDDLGLRHTGTDFAREVMHADLNQDLRFDANTSLSLQLTLPLPIFVGLPNPLPFTYAAAASPDSFNPLSDGSVALATWDANGAGIIAYQNGLQRHLIMGFSTQRLSPAYRQTLISNLFNWALISTGFDTHVTNINQSSNVDSSPFRDGNAFIADPFVQSTPFLRDLNATETQLIATLPNYLKPGSNVIPLRIANTGAQAATSIPVQIFLDNNLMQTQTVSINPQSYIDINTTLNLSPGKHVLKVITNPAYGGNELNVLNNVSEKTIAVAPSLPNLRVMALQSNLDTNAMKIEFEVANLGGSTASGNVFLSFADWNASTTMSLSPGKVWRKWINTNRPRQTIDANVVIDRNNSISESAEGDNALQQRIYFCKFAPILIVDDDSGLAYVDVNASSAELFHHYVQELGFCPTLWKESTQGVPSANLLNQFPMVIWSVGDYWSNAIDGNDVAAIQQYNGNVWFEGNDIGFDQHDSNFLSDYFGVDLNRDIFVPSGVTQLSINPLISIPGFSYLDLNLTYSSFPDAFDPLAGAISIWDWNNGGSAMTLFGDNNQARLLMGFALDSISSSTMQQLLVGGGMIALAPPTNNPPSIPTGILCNNASCIDGNYTGVLGLACTGSVDPENDPITYSLESRVGSGVPSPGLQPWWDINWGHKIPITLTNLQSVPLNNYRANIQLNGIGADFWNNLDSNGNCLRFTDSNESTDIPYWYRSFSDGTDANVVVRLQETLPANASKTIYAYVRDASCLAVSNKPATVNWSDDFSLDLLSTQYQTVDGIDGPGAHQVVVANQQMEFQSSDPFYGWVSKYRALDYPTKRIQGSIDKTGGGTRSEFVFSVVAYDAQNSPQNETNRDDVDGVKMMEWMENFSNGNYPFNYSYPSTQPTGYVNARHYDVLMCCTLQSSQDNYWYLLYTDPEPSVSFGSLQTLATNTEGSWIPILSITAGQTQYINVSSISPAIHPVDLRCSASDPAGLNSPYFTVDANLSVGN